ncbi:MAG TPA: BPSL0067 family protein [Thermoanaerobaculia bacterium]|nr:BPSL0067 family protein [Thermoanaerobaculia bacterium]
MTTRALAVAAVVLGMGLAGCGAGGGTTDPSFAVGPHLAAHPEAFVGEVVGDGHCVAFVKVAAGAPRTSEWRPGARVRGNPRIARGTAIATFEADGTYTSRTGNHAAIYLGQDEAGLWVYDQWRGQPVHERRIRFEGGAGSGRGSKSNDGKLFAVIM